MDITVDQDGYTVYTVHLMPASFDGWLQRAVFNDGVERFPLNSYVDVLFFSALYSATPSLTSWEDPVLRAIHPEDDPYTDVLSVSYKGSR
jgi:hypothetical protein